MLVSTTTVSNRACRSKCCFRSCCLFFQLIKLMIQVKKESFRVNICLVFLMEFFNVIFQQLNLHTDASCHHKALIISGNCIFMFLCGFNACPCKPKLIEKYWMGIMKNNNNIFLLAISRWEQFGSNIHDKLKLFYNKYPY